MVKAILLAGALVLANVGIASAFAQEYPTKPVRFVVPAAPGLATDVLGRIFAAEFQKVLNQPVIVENRPGAGGDLGALEVVKAAPDGYTLLFSSASVLFGNKWLYPRTFDQEKDLVPIIHVSDSPMVLLKGPEFKNKNLREILAMGKSVSKPYAFGAASTFSAVVYGMLQEASGVEFLLVRYRSNQQAFVELIRGEIQLIFEAIPSAKPMISDGRLVPIAVSSANRSGALPDVPTLRELGYDVDLIGFNAIAGPRGIPPHIVEVLNRAGNEILKKPDLKQRLAALSTEVKGGTPEEMARTVRANSEVWGRMIKKFDLKH